MKDFFFPSWEPIVCIILFLSIIGTHYFYEIISFYFYIIEICVTVAGICLVAVVVKGKNIYPKGHWKIRE